MFAKLEGLEKKYMELEEALAQPDVFNDQEHYRKLTKAHADLREIVAAGAGRKQADAARRGSRHTRNGP